MSVTIVKGRKRKKESERESASEQARLAVRGQLRQEDLDFEASLD